MMSAATQKKITIPIYDRETREYILNIINIIETSRDSTVSKSLLSHHLRESLIGVFFDSDEKGKLAGRVE